MSTPELTGLVISTELGEIITNVGAVATYECVDPDDMLMGMNQLICSRSEGGNFTEWSPSSAPNCTEPSESKYLL